jgi:hypothetical protein
MECKSCGIRGVRALLWGVLAVHILVQPGALPPHSPDLQASYRALAWSSSTGVCRSLSIGTCGPASRKGVSTASGLGGLAARLALVRSPSLSRTRLNSVTDRSCCRFCPAPSGRQNLSCRTQMQSGRVCPRSGWRPVCKTGESLCPQECICDVAWGPC